MQKMKTMQVIWIMLTKLHSTSAALLILQPFFIPNYLNHFLIEFLLLTYARSAASSIYTGFL